MPKKVASKKASKPIKKVVRTAAKSSVKAATKNMSAWDTYCAERDAFYRNHPNSQWLIAVLILVILVYLGLYFWSQATMMGWM